MWWYRSRGRYKKRGGWLEYWSFYWKGSKGGARGNKTYKISAVEKIYTPHYHGILIRIMILFVTSEGTQEI